MASRTVMRLRVVRRAQRMVGHQRRTRQLYVDVLIDSKHDSPAGVQSQAGEPTHVPPTRVMSREKVVWRRNAMNRQALSRATPREPCGPCRGLKRQNKRMLFCPLLRYRKASGERGGNAPYLNPNLASAPRASSCVIPWCVEKKRECAQVPSETGGMKARYSSASVDGSCGGERVVKTL